MDSDEVFKADQSGDDLEEQKVLLEQPDRKPEDIDETQVIGCVMVLVIRNFNKYLAKHIRIEFPE